MGSDPELFVKDGDRIIGSEKVIPPEGLLGIVRDGVQIELHPEPYVCRASAANTLAGLFHSLQRHLSKVPSLSVCFDEVVELSKAEMDELSPESRVLGCQPSLNIYDDKAEVRVPPDYPVRSAGGHIHVGNSLQGEDAKRFIAVMDVLVGNTCVLIDRHPKAAERRQVYGRAGEYRIQPYGVEYRTLSNFWLQGHQLWSLIGGLTKLAQGIVSYRGHYEKTGKKDAWGYDQMDWVKPEGCDPVKDLFANVEQELVRKAINENDLSLAYKNWEGVKAFLTEHVPQQDSGLHAENLENFEYFAKVVQEKGLQTFFGDPLRQWLYLGDQHGRGWESFSDQVLTGARMRGDHAS